MAVAQEAEQSPPTREEILSSPRWREARRAFNEWLSIQQIYTPEQVEEIRTGLKARVAEMSAEELEDMLISMEERLDVLLSPEADEARAWLANFLSVQAMYSPEEVQQMLPDVVNMTARQIHQELEQLRLRRGQAQRQHAAFDASRQQQVDRARAARQAAERRDRQRASQPAASPAREVRSPYAPRRSRAQEPLEQRFFINSWGNIGRVW